MPAKLILRDPPSANAAKRAAIDAAFETRMDVGAPWNFGTEQSPDWQTLQVRNADDKANWLIFKDTVNDMLMANLGDQLVPLPIRVTANVNYQVTATVGAAAINAMKAWGAVLMQNHWDLSDACVAAGEDAEALAAIDPESGWPG